MDFKQAYLVANDLKVSYHRSADSHGKSPLLLLHGFADNGRCWSRVANELASHCDVIMPDARGHGRTEGSTQDFSYEQLGEDALVIIEALELEQPFLFGHSMGALTALITAARSSHMVKGIILEDPPFGNAQRPHVLQVKFLEKAAKEGKSFQKRPLSERIIACRINNPDWVEEEVVPWAESKGEYDPDILAPDVRIRMRQYPWRVAATQVECPVLLVTANPAKGGIVTPKIAAEAAKLLPTCKIVQVSSAGHSIHRDAYKETMKFVNVFLNSITGRNSTNLADSVDWI